MKPMRPRSSRSATSLVRAASTSRIAFSGEIGSIVTAIARTICACRSKGREEGGADVDARPARDPVGRVERRRPCGRRSTTSRSRAARRRPRRCRRGRGRPRRAARGRAATRGRTRRGSRSRASRAEARRRRARRRRPGARRAPSSSRSRTRAGARVRSLLAARALDLTPRALGVDLQADEELVIRASRPGRCSSARGTTASASESSGTASRSHASPR